MSRKINKYKKKAQKYISDEILSKKLSTENVRRENF
jgi:hypothetical protein